MGMSMGILFMTITAFWWVVLGAVISNAAQKNLNLSFIQGGSAILIMLVTLPLYFFAGIDIPLPVLIALPVSGLCNYATFIFMNKAMQTGPNGLIWAMVQSAFVMPFLMGVLFFGVPCSVTRVIGLFLILAAMVMMGLVGNSKGSAGTGKMAWILFALTSYLLAGITQCSANLPSYILPPGNSNLLNVLFRVGLGSSGFFFGYIFHGMINRKAYGWNGCMPSTLIMAVTTIASMLFTFFGLDFLAQNNAGAIGYPIVVGVSIAVFMVYTAIKLKEKLSFSTLCSVLLCLAGIIVISI